MYYDIKLLITPKKFYNFDFFKYKLAIVNTTGLKNY